MIDEKEILPFNFFAYGGVYSGSHGGMRYRIARIGKKPDFQLEGSVWKGPYCYAAVSPEQRITQQFPYSEEGRSAAIEWLLQQYQAHLPTWEIMENILDAPITLHYADSESKA